MISFSAGAREDRSSRIYLHCVSYCKCVFGIRQGRNCVQREYRPFIYSCTMYIAYELLFLHDHIVSQVCGSKTTSCLTQSELRKALRLSLHIQSEESNKIFQQARNDGDDVSFGKCLFLFPTPFIFISYPSINARKIFFFKPVCFLQTTS